MDRQLIHSTDLWIDLSDNDGTVFWFEIHRIRESPESEKKYRYTITLWKKTHEVDQVVDTGKIEYWEEYFNPKKISQVLLNNVFHHEKKARGFANARISSMVANKKRKMSKLTDDMTFRKWMEEVRKRLSFMNNILNKYVEE